MVDDPALNSAIHSGHPTVLAYMVTICPGRRRRSISNPGDYRRLKSLAGTKGVAPAQLVREAVAEYVARHEAGGVPEHRQVQQQAR